MLYSSLKKRFRNCKNINIFNYAVSDTNSQGILYLQNKNQKDLKKLEGSSLEKNKKNINKDHTQKIKLIHIKKIISSFEYIDCIKIDIEGHEYKILDSLIENKDKIGKVVCEFHGTDEDLKNNKNFEFRKDYLIFRDKILKHKKNKWLIEWI